jgi:hypothetical protein
MGGVVTAPHHDLTFDGHVAVRLLTITVQRVPISGIFSWRSATQQKHYSREQGWKQEERHHCYLLPTSCRMLK